MKVIGPIGRDNVEQIKIKYQGVAFSFDTFGVTSAQVIAGDKFISSTNGDVSYSGDTLSVKFGKLQLEAGSYNAQIVLFSASHPAGIVIAGPGMPETIELLMI
jgi:hypothetical protein